VGETFFENVFAVDTPDGAVVLSSSLDGTGTVYVDDQITIQVDHPDGTTASYSHNYNFDGGCGGIQSTPPVDLSELLVPGHNTVRLNFADTCGIAEGSSDFYLVGNGTFNEVGTSSSVHTDSFDIVRSIQPFSTSACAARLLASGVPSSSPLCAALRISANTPPWPDLSSLNLKDMIAGKEYRGYAHIPAFDIECEAGSVRSVTPSVPPGFSFSYGYTKVPTSRTSFSYHLGDPYTEDVAFNQPELSVAIGDGFVVMRHLQASRLSNPERLKQYPVSTYDAPFIWSVFSQRVSCDGSVQRTVAYNTFPTTDLYIDGYPVLEDEQDNSGIGSFFVSGGHILHRPGHGNLNFPCNIRQFPGTGTAPLALPKNPLTRAQCKEAISTGYLS
jgi:hypothetical protein